MSRLNSSPEKMKDALTNALRVRRQCWKTQSFGSGSSSASCYSGVRWSVSGTAGGGATGSVIESGLREAGSVRWD
jgi:hypothetical protein